LSEDDSNSEKTRRILVVDDEPATARLVRDWFRNQNYEILEAPNGATGIELALSGRPDLILLDLAMPDMDGISVARQLKSDPSTRTLPIILLTACGDVNAKVEAFSAGADDYITKPFEFEEVDARIQSMLRKREFLVTLETTVRDLAETNEQLEQLLIVDEKTGLYNFRQFQKRLHEEWERSSRYLVPLSLVFLDLDHFKNVNDTLGHPAGDVILQEFATLVTGGARANDVAARYGGEEFAVILPHTDQEMATRVAERIRRAVADFVFLRDESPTKISVSAGVATHPAGKEIDSVDALVRAADRALYQAKDRGRNRVCRSPSAASSGESEVGAAPPRRPTKDPTV
jgi:two-component system cell cycle response regulator